MHKSMVIAITLLVGASIWVAPPAALAGGQEVIQRGSCSAQSDWKLKVKPDNSRLELEFEVDPERCRRGLECSDQAERLSDLRGHTDHARGRADRSR